jgi:hypothetical protein
MYRACYQQRLLYGILPPKAPGTECMLPQTNFHPYPWYMQVGRNEIVWAHFFLLGNGVHPSIHTYIHACMHAYIQTNIHTYILYVMYTCVCVCVSRWRLTKTRCRILFLTTMASTLSTRRTRYILDTCMHTYGIYLHTYMQAYMHKYVHACMHACLY